MYAMNVDANTLLELEFLVCSDILLFNTPIEVMNSSLISMLVMYEAFFADATKGIAVFAPRHSNLHAKTVGWK